MSVDGAWLTFCAGSLSCFLTGSIYTFGAWSPALKTVFGYSQAQIGHLGTAKDFGVFISMDAGLLTGRCGASATLAVGSSSMFAGTIAIWALLRAEADVPFVVMVLVFWIFGHGLGFLDNAGIATSIRNFPKRKGTAVGLMKALEGITTAVMGTIFYTLFSAPEDLASYPLILAIAAFLVGITCVPIMIRTNRPCTEPDLVVQKKFSVLVVGLLCFIVYCAVIAAMKTYNPATMAICLLGLLSMFLLVIPLGGEDARDQLAGGVVEAVGGAAVVERVDLSVCQMFTTFDFYALFFVLFVAQGVGVMYANNVAQITQAVMNDADAESGLVAAMFSVFNSAGRVFYGYGSEALKLRVNRPWFLCITCTSMALCMALLNASSTLLIPVSALMGLSLGGTFAVQAVIIEEVFGPTDLPLKYSCCFACAFVGSFTFSDQLASSLYDAEARRQGVTTCLGPDCFGTTAYVCLTCCLVALVLAVVLALRSRGAYVKVNAALGKLHPITEPMNCPDPLLQDGE